MAGGSYRGMAAVGVKPGECVLVLKLAFSVRLVMFVGQVLSNIIIPDHHGSMEDVEMKVHRFPDHDWLTETLLGGFDNWDSEYYIHIASRGYTSLQTMAFFPLYPGLMWLVARIPLFLFNYLLSDRSLFLLSGTVVNITIFPLSAVALYLLTLSVTSNRKLSLMTVLLFCINPASVFMSAVYTETLFSFFTFSGFCFLTHGYHWMASILFSLSSATRSNGIVLAGFIGYYHLSLIIHFFRQKSTSSIFNLAKFFSKCIAVCSVECLLVIIPFLLFQLYSYTKFCHQPARGEEMFGWCQWSLPLSYPYIQEHYWNVGFLRYFQLKQIPNFLLAMPAVILSLATIYQYCSGTFNPFKYSGLEALAYMMHLLFLVGFGIFNMHVQVLTRFLFSSTPLLYWFSAWVLCDVPPSYPTIPSSSSSSSISLFIGPAKVLFNHPNQQSRTLTTAKLIVLYYISYVVIGFVLHCNFYPWT